MQGFLRSIRGGKRKTVGVFYMQPGEVRFLFFENRKNERKILSYGVERGVEWETAKLLDSVLAGAGKRKTISELIVSFPAEHFRAYIAQETISPPHSKHQITLRDARELEKRMKTAAQRTFRRVLFRETGILPDDFTLQQVALLSRSIDGYGVSRLHGYRRGEVGFSALGLFLLERVLFPVKQAAKAHGISKIRAVHIVEAVAEFAASKEKEGVYLELEDTNTQMIIWKKSGLGFPGVVPMGAAHFARALIKEFGMSESMVREFGEKHAKGTLSAPSQARVSAALLPELQKFGKLVRSRLAQARPPLPQSVFVLGRREGMDNLETIFGDHAEEEVPFRGIPSFAFLLPKDVWPGVEFPENGNAAYTPLCLFGSTKP